VVLNRSDIATTSPDKANYKLAINSWIQVQKEEKIAWAGKFEYPTDGKVPHAQFRNMKFRPATATRSAKEMELDGGGMVESGNRTRFAFEDDGEEVDDGSEGGSGKKQVKVPSVDDSKKKAPAVDDSKKKAPAVDDSKKKKSSAKKTSESNGVLASLAFIFVAAVALL